mmetsp:Transcript_48056/g.99235  ORF Transcript_48056/g.99235 Transcript_48056/m.99235 type:complete len:278 (-) Transcript_48056:962-1795(-)
MIPRGFSGELPTALEPDLLQGVPLSTCLGGWGQHWSSSLTARNQESLSQRTTKIDAFLSHDWGTSRWLKFLSLLANSARQRPAADLAGLRRSFLLPLLLAACSRPLPGLSAGLPRQALHLPNGSCEEGAGDPGPRRLSQGVPAPRGPVVPPLLQPSLVHLRTSDVLASEQRDAQSLRHAGEDGRASPDHVHCLAGGSHQQPGLDIHCEGPLLEVSGACRDGFHVSCYGSPVQLHWLGALLRYRGVAEATARFPDSASGLHLLSEGPSTPGDWRGDGL